MFRYSAVRLLLVLALQGCALEPGSPALSGRYPLLALNGEDLPFDTGSIPPPPGADSSCHILVADGYLDLQRATARYEIQYANIESCSGRVLGQSGSSGSFRQRGSRLELTADLGAGRMKLFVGSVRDSKISVADDFYAYVFAR